MSLSQEQQSAYLYELKINEYEKDIKWQNDLDRLPNDPVSSAHKLVFKHIRAILKALRNDLSTPTCIHNTELMNRTGLSEDAVQQKIKDLTEWGWITRQTKRFKKANGEIATEQKIGITGSLRVDINKTPLPKKRNHGGDRQRCERCGSENIDIYVAYECRDCGHIHQADITHQHGSSL